MSTPPTFTDLREAVNELQRNAQGPFENLLLACGTLSTPTERKPPLTLKDLMALKALLKEQGVPEPYYAHVPEEYAPLARAAGVIPLDAREKRYARTHRSTQPESSKTGQRPHLK